MNGSNYVFSLIFILLFIMLTSEMALSQELVPRRWSHLPTGTNFVGGGYAYTRADVSFDPVLQIEDAKLDMHTVEVSYIRTVGLLGKSARADFKIPLQDARWKGLLAGQPASAHRQGIADPVVRLAVNFLGGPPLKGENFAAYRADHEVETIVGLALAVHLPLGQYSEDKLLNLGSNRFTIRPQLGVEHKRGNWIAEFTASIWFFTDNNSFFNGLCREQDPFFTAQAHLIYNFRPGFWASMSGALGYGGESTIDNVEIDDIRRNVGWALGIGYSVTRHVGMNFRYVGIYNLSDVGTDSNTLIVGASCFW